MSGALRLGPVVLGCLAVLLFWDSLRVADPDLFVTLYAGAEILAHGGPPGVDSATFSVRGGPWIDYEWLARALYALAYRELGPAGVVLLRDLLGACLLAIVGWRALRLRVGFGALAVVLLLLAFGLHDYVFFRPRLFTFVALAGLFVGVEAARRRPWLLLAAPPAVVLWINLHGGAALGVVLLGLLAGESAASLAVQELSRRGVDAPRRLFESFETRGVLPLRFTLPCFLAAALASGLHPFGWSNWAAVVDTMTLATLPTFTEWRGLTSYPPGMQAPWWLLVGFVTAVLAAGRRRVTPFEAAAVGALAVVGVHRVRFLALFLVAASLVLLKALPALADAWRRRRGGGAPLRPRPWAAWVLAAGALAAVAGFRTPRHLDILKQPSLTPVAGVHFLEATGIRGRVLNEYDWGGYLHFRLPDAPIFVDGRADTVYPAEVLGDWLRFTATGPGWRDVPRRWDADLVFMRRFHPAVQALARDRRWVLAFADAGSVIFLRRSPEHAPWIEALEQGRFQVPEPTPEDYRLRDPRARPAEVAAGDGGG